MIKGIRRGGTGKTLTFLDTLTIPIIENTPDEEDLTDSMAEAMERYPEAGAVLVRRHGVYIWGASRAFLFSRPGLEALAAVAKAALRSTAGSTWEQAKTQAECFDYLFEVGASNSPAMLNLRLTTALVRRLPSR